jgi:arabinose-5-phosphate isomerase
VIKDLLQREQEYLNHFFNHVNLEMLEQFVELFQNCKGMIILTGVGKSGLIAEKIAMTMTSTGTRAFFLAPINALHGDIGIVTSDDIVVMLSKSGETDELMHLVPFMRNKGAVLTAITCNPTSRLARAVDHVFPVPNEKELCPFDLAPTTSTTIQMILGDVLAIAMMENRHFSMDDFAKNHPAGRIGRRMVTRVKDLMMTGTAIPLCQPEDKLVDVLVELSNKRCGCVLISNDNHELLGIFTDGDLRRSLQNKGAVALESKMKDVMTKNPRWIDEKELAWEAVLKMEEDQKRPIMVLAVLNEEKKVAGIIKMHDLVQSGL